MDNGSLPKYREMIPVPGHEIHPYRFKIQRNFDIKAIKDCPLFKG